MSQHDEDIEVTARYRRWLDEASNAMGGMDICALDGVHDSKSGKEYIIELNDSAIGFNSRHMTHDICDVKTLVISLLASTYQHDFTRLTGIASLPSMTDTKTTSTSPSTREMGGDSKEWLNERNRLIAECNALHAQLRRAPQTARAVSTMITPSRRSVASVADSSTSKKNSGDGVLAQQPLIRAALIILLFAVLLRQFYGLFTITTSSLV
jgi:hypothetical protein